MSVGFGFSIGDIVLMSQLAYRLYTGVTSGRKSASADLKELGDALFGLHCALNHLRQTAEVIDSRASSARLEGDAVQMRRNLDSMIDSCASTLNDLDNATKIYRDVEQAGGALDQDEADPSKPSSETVGRRQRVIKRWRQQLKVQWNRVQWEFKGTSIDEYRQKLQAHTAAITIVLNTFILSATDRIEIDGQNQTRTLQHFQDRELKFNEDLMAAVQGIRDMLLTSQAKHTRLAANVKTSTVDASCIAPPALHAQPLSSTAFKYSGPSPAEEFDVAKAGFVSRIAVVEEAPLPDIPMDIDQPHPFFASARPTGTSLSFRPPSSSLPQLPPNLQSINEQRRLVGSREFQQFQQRYRVHAQTSKPSFLERAAPSVSQLLEGLEFVFRPLYSPTAGMNLSNPEVREREVIDWIRALDSVVETTFPTSETISPTGSHLGKTLNRQAHTPAANELIELLATLNRAVEQSDAVVRRNFYRASQLGHLDKVFDRMQRVSKSVRCRKEIEEFEDMREEWEGT